MTVINASDPTAKALQNDLQILDQSLLLEALPYACLLYNRAEDRVLAGNQAFWELTGFSAKDNSRQPLSTFIPDEQDTNPTGSETRPIRLRLASADLLLAALRVLSISLNNQMVILVFTPPEAESEIRQELLAKEFLYDNLTMLTRVSQAASSSEALKIATEIITKTINPQTTAVYLLQKETNQLTRIKADGPGQGLFPDVIGENLFELLPNLFLWRLGKKPRCGLHEQAILAGFEYVLTVPLDYLGTPLGLLAAAGQTPVPDDESLRYMALLAAHTAASCQNLTTLENTRKSLEGVRQIIRMQNVISDNLEEGIIILTPDLRVAEMNPAAETMLGYATKEVFLQPAEMVLIANESLLPLYNSAQQGISTLAGDNLTLNTRNGRTLPAQVICLPVTAGAKLQSIVLLLRDLSQTEQIRAHSKQLEQRAFLGEISAIFAHEVKNPINNIMVGLQYLQTRQKPDNPDNELISKIYADCQRLTHLMDSTLTFSKPMEYHFATVDLSDLIPFILERWEPRMKRLNIQYNFEANPAHPIVEGDARALEQVFVNLISNATQAMENTGGTLAVRVLPADASMRPPHYEIIVADTGPGIPDDLRERIFEPFVTTNSSGTGLGLAITKRIITAHKGSIYVESFPGGTMFHILLPRMEKIEK